VRRSLRDDNKRYTTTFERGGRVATESFALASAFAGETQVIADMATDNRFEEATTWRAELRESGLRARLAVPLFAGGHVSGALVVMSTIAGMYTDGRASEPSRALRDTEVSRRRMACTCR
jgi:transcriptional regulator with GAF, ATPase, and Fis domain